MATQSIAPERAELALYAVGQISTLLSMLRRERARIEFEFEPIAMAAFRRISELNTAIAAVVGSDDTYTDAKLHEVVNDAESEAEHA